MTAELFNEFALLLSLSVAIGFVAVKIRQPLILSFIVVGIIAGPAVLGWIQAQNEIEVLASFGVTLLLFIVGLKLDLHEIKALGPMAVMLGVCQILITAAIGFAIAFAFGIDLISSIFIALSVSLSSTIIIVKVLSDRGEIDALYGRIAVGILIVQDIFVVLVIIVLASLSVHYATYKELQIELVSLLLKGAGFLAVLAFMMRYVLPRLLEQLAKSRELLVLFAISWAVIVAMGGEKLGFGTEIGGFLAGVTLASTHYREAMASRLETVRDLLLIFFFLNLGASLQLHNLATEIWPVIVLSLFVLVGKPLIVMLLMNRMNFKKRTGFLTGVSLAQVSEFSLILTALGVQLGYLDAQITSLITLVALITIGLSTYMMAYMNPLYHFVSPALFWLGRKESNREEAHQSQNLLSYDVVIYGFGRHGKHLAKILESYGMKILGIDFDPRKVRHWKDDNIRIHYGDAEDMEFPRVLPLENVQWVVSTIPSYKTNNALVAALREHNYTGKIALNAYHEGEVEWAKKLGVDLVLVPFKDAALSAAKQLAGE